MINLTPSCLAKRIVNYMVISVSIRSDTACDGGIFSGSDVRRLCIF